MKRLATILTCMLLASSISACVPDRIPDMPQASGSVAAPEVEPASWQKKTDPVTLSMAATNVWLDTDGQFPLWAEDEVSRRIADLTGVKLDILAGSEASSMQGMLQVIEAADEYPDLLFVHADEEILRLSDPSYSLPLDELAAQYCPDFWDSLDPLEILNNQQADGHVYTLRRGYMTQEAYDDPAIGLQPPRVLTLRRDLLERLGRDMPQSIEDLEELLKLVRDQGQALDVRYPLRQYAVTDSPIAEWMGVRRYLTWDEEAGLVRTPLRDPNWLAYFQLMNRWYREGLLVLPEKEICWRSDYDLPWAYASEETISASQYYERAMGLEFATAAGRVSTNESLYPVRKRVSGDAAPFAYSMVEEPLTYGGEIRLQAADHRAYWDEQHTAFGYTRGGLFITSGCVQKERAILFMQFLKGREGAQLVSWGVEGIHYERDDQGNLIYLPEYRNDEDYINENTHALSKHGVDYWNWMDNSWVAGRLAASPVSYYTNQDALALHQMRIRAGQNYKAYAEKNKNPIFHFAEPTAGTEAYTAYIRLQDEWYHGAWELVHAPNEEAVAEGWEKLMGDMTMAGLDSLEAEMTVRFKDALARYQAAGYFTEIKTGS